MKTIIDVICKNRKAYLEACWQGLRQKMEVYYIDFTRGETNSSTFICLPKGNLKPKAAYAMLIHRALMVYEEMFDFENYSKLDVALLNEQIQANYKNTQYISNLDLNLERDGAFVFPELGYGWQPEKIYLHDYYPIDFETFDKLNPLRHAKIIAASRTKFNEKELETEYYMETETHFLLLHWHTTA